MWQTMEEIEYESCSEESEDEEEEYVEFPDLEHDDNIMKHLKELYVGYSTKRGFPDGYEVRGWCQPWKKLSNVVDRETYLHICNDDSPCYGKIRLSEVRMRDFYDAAHALIEHYDVDAPWEGVMAHMIDYQFS